MKTNTFFYSLITWIISIMFIMLTPVLYYFIGWIIGHLLDWFVGDTITNGLNYLFNTTRFAADKLPMLCGTLNVIGSFFKSTTTVKFKT